MTSQELRLKRLLYRAKYRGCKETDYLLGDFFYDQIDQIKIFGLELCEKFLSEDDMLIYDWLLAKEICPNHYQNLVLAIQKFHNL